MFRNTLFSKLFLLLVLAGAFLLSSTYYLTIPLVDKRIYEIEERSGKVALDSVYVLLKRTKQDIVALEACSLKNHKKNLKNIVDIATTCLSRIRQKHDEGMLTLEQARQEAIAEISCFRYSNNDYLYVSDYRGNLVYHPDSYLNGTNISDLKDIHGKLIISPMIEKSRISGDTYYEYWWNRLGEEKPSHKLTYARDLPRWGWVIYSGVYLDDIQDESELRKEELIAFLREYVRSSRIATSGYLYIFDGDQNMVIHPNANIEGKNFADLKNPGTGKSIGEELMAVVDAGNNRFGYIWDKPTDPGHYVYEKVAWVRYLPEYDYYVASSVYLDDLQRSGNLLATRLFQVTVLTIFLLTVCGLALIYSVINAVKKLALVANRIVSGDLTGKVEIDRNDEIGQLGHSFNLMVDKLKEQIDNLEEGVEERTASLSLMVDQLEQHNAETDLLKDANEMLQACRNENEVFEAVKLIMQKAFPGNYSSLLSLVYEGQRLDVVAECNCTHGNTGGIYDHDACFAMRRGSTYVLNDAKKQMSCPHTELFAPECSICTPVTAYGETFGILHLRHTIKDEKQTAKMVALIENIAEYTANTLANLQLRLRLQQQSIRDSLTGLFNRRYMDEALHQEESRARRNSMQVGLMMLDVDHFKLFNDSHGHEAGDEILRILGKLLRNHFRESDIPCRYGGEEFIVILPDISLEQCRAKAEQLRIAVEDGVQIFRLGENLGITISVGVALFPLHDGEMRTVLKCADNALYLAKDQGRNRVVCAE